MNQAYDPATLDFYADEAPVYAASGPGGASARLHGFLDRLTPGARILELGCGGGRDAAAMLAAGFDVDATDGSPALAAEAEARIGRPVRVMRFDELDVAAGYDAVWAHASLLHVPFDALPGVLARVHRALRPSGWHFASFKAAGGYFGEAENGSGGPDSLGRYFNYPGRDALLDAYRAAGEWLMLETEEHLGGGYDRVAGPWIALTARRR